MDERREIRASDSDRAAAVERLRAALDEGRLSLLEYDDRLARAYQSVTYGDLADLFADLPDVAPAAASPTAAGAAARAAPTPAKASVGVVRALPTWLRVLWTIWLTVVSINVVIWALVSASNADLHYFWPMWVAGPSGAALLALSAGATAIRHGREAEQQRRPQPPRVQPPRRQPPRRQIPRNRRAPR